MATTDDTADRITSTDAATRWQAVFDLCGRVALYFDEQARPDLASDAAARLIEKLHAGRPEPKPGKAMNLKAYYEKVAFNHMRRRAKHWRKWGRSLSPSLC